MKSSKTALVVILSSVVLVAIVGAVIAFTLSFNDLPGSNPDRHEPDPDDPQSEVVLNATWADGSELSDDELDNTWDVITGRLDLAGLESTGYYLDDHQMHVTFDDDADEVTLQRASEALTVSYEADLRPVLEATLDCDAAAVQEDIDPSEEVTLCAQDDFEQYLLGPTEIEGSTIVGVTAAEATNSQGVSTGGWNVTIVFDQDGARYFANLTQRLFGAGEGHNRLAIVLNGEVLSAPTVNAAILNGEVTISGDFDEAEARDLAAQLRSASRGLELSVASSHLID